MLDLKPRPATRNEKLLYATAFGVLFIAWLADAVGWYWCLLPALYFAASLWHTPKTVVLPTPASAPDPQPTVFAPTRQQPAPSVSTPGVDLPCTFQFSYIDHHDQFAPRTVDVQFVSRNVNTGHTYLEGFCHDRMDNRTFRTDRIQSDLTDVETGELVPVERVVSSALPAPGMDYKTSTQRPERHTTKKWQTAVFFAGFRGGKLAELEGIAAAAGWQIRWSISPTVDYVVRNGSAGKQQLAEAENLGVAVIDEATFRALAY